MKRQPQIAGDVHRQNRSLSPFDVRRRTLHCRRRLEPLGLILFFRLHIVRGWPAAPELGRSSAVGFIKLSLAQACLPVRFGVPYR